MSINDTRTPATPDQEVGDPNLYYLNTDYSDDPFEEAEAQFFATYQQTEDGVYSVGESVPQDPKILSFSTFWLAIQYLSSQPFPISDLSQYAIVFPLQFWPSFPRSSRLDRVPCNLIKIS